MIHQILKRFRVWSLMWRFLEASVEGNLGGGMPRVVTTVQQRLEPGRETRGSCCKETLGPTVDGWGIDFRGRPIVRHHHHPLLCISF